MTTDITFATATELAAHFAAGAASPVQATRDSLAQIERHDPDYNAYCLVDSESALRQAAESEARWASGTPLSPLDGVPISIKDMFLTSGWPTLRGSACVDATQAWNVDAPITARLREHGLVLLGKTTTPELAWKATTDSPLTGATGNPWNPATTSGGSSGGSAAAVAAGMGPLSVGTDGGGSIRIPASFCGIVGFKPTYGTIPLYPSSPFGALAHAGPMARSVDDAAALLDVLAKPDHRDPSAQPAPTTPFRAAASREPRGITAAFSATLGYVDVDPEIAAIVRDAVAALAAAGLKIEEANPGFSDPAAPFEVLWSAGAAKWLNTFPDGAENKVDPGLLRVWRKGVRYSAMDYLAAQEARAALGIQMGEFHTRYDLLITPMMPIHPFPIGHDVPPGSGLSSWWQWTQFSYPFNLTQQPAISVPAGVAANGLPVGVQIIGPRHADGLVLAAAKLLQTVRPWPSGPPHLTG